MKKIFLALAITVGCGGTLPIAQAAEQTQDPILASFERAFKTDQTGHLTEHDLLVASFTRGFADQSDPLLTQKPVGPEMDRLTHEINIAFWRQEVPTAPKQTALVTTPKISKDL
ncbi:MAG: hypothetical protein H7832_12695 [Magnetococcus sp. DMHC-6]